MRRDKAKPSLTAPRVMLPSWCNPLFLLTVGDYQIDELSLGAGVITKVAGNDPERFMIGFQVGSGTTGAVMVSPQSRPSLFGESVAGHGSILWLSLFDRGPMVSYDWYASSVGAQLFFVHRVVIRG